MLLAVDTSTHISSIALHDDHGVCGEVSWRSRENHTRSLMPEIVRLLEMVGTNTNALRAIGVATGPGSFTGLRIGLSAAKGLAFSLNVAIIGVPTLDIVASMHTPQNLPTCAILQVGRGRYGAAFYESRDGTVQRVSDYFFGAPESLAQDLSRQPFVPFFAAGEIDDALRAVLRFTFASRIFFASVGSEIRRAGFLGALAWQRWQNGAVDDLQTLAPYYIPTASLA